LKKSYNTDKKALSRERRGPGVKGGKEGEMTQTLYTHMNKRKNIFKKEKGQVNQENLRNIEIIPPPHTPE
jgi:hypothetical protein